MAFMSVTRPGWLLTVIGIAVFAVAARLNTPHRTKCCGLRFTPEQYAWHVKEAHHNE